MRKILLLALVCISSLFSVQLEEQSIVVVIPSYQNKKWSSLNLKSVFDQDYQNFRVICIDDASLDGTGKKIEEIVQKYQNKGQYSFIRCDFNNRSGSIQTLSSQFSEQINKTNAFFRLVTNSCRSGTLSNIYRSVLSCKDNEIVVVLSGDDWFADDQVLKRLNELYSSNQVWMTHGGSVEYISNALSSSPISQTIIDSNAFRTIESPTHLCSFRSWLFKKINVTDLLFGGKFFPMAWESAIMYPMIEMAGERHAYIQEISHVHNQSSSLNYTKLDPTLKSILTRFIMEKQPYKRLVDKEDRINIAPKVIAENRTNSLIEMELLNFKMGGVSQRDMFKGS